jgi:hypothetical protein
MVFEIVLYVQIVLEGEYAVTTEEDEDGQTAQFRRPDETLAGIAGSFHKDHAHIARERASETQRIGQNTKRDEGTTGTLPRSVVAEQWLCFLLGLICLICGVYGLFMKYNRDSPNAYIQWLGPAYGPILRFTAISCIALGAVLVRQGVGKTGPVFFLSRAASFAISIRHRSPRSKWKWIGKH